MAGKWEELEAARDYVRERIRLMVTKINHLAQFLPHLSQIIEGLEKKSIAAHILGIQIDISNRKEN